MRRKHFIVMMLTLLMVVQIIFPGTGAFAAGSLTMSVSADKTMLNQADDVHFKIQIKNNAEGNIKDLKLTAKAGNTSTPVNLSTTSLGSKQVLDIECTIRVEPGTSISFIVEGMDEEAGVAANASQSVGIAKENKSLSFDRKTNKTVAALNEDVTLTYTIKNNGNVEMKDIKVSDGSLVTFDPFNLAPNESKVLTHKMNVSGEIVSQPRLEANGRVIEGDKLIIRLAEPKLEVTLKADQTQVTQGDTVTLTCIIKNTGNVDYKNVVIEDDNLGKLKSYATIGAGKVQTFTKKLTINETQSFLFHVTAKDASGNSYAEDSQRIEISTGDATETTDPVSGDSRLEIKVSSDVTTLKEAGKVNFDIVVSNKDSQPLKDVVIIENSKGEIGTMDKLDLDKLFKKSYDVTETTSFIFKVTAKDAKGKTIEAISEPVEIKVGEEEKLSEEPADDDASPSEETPVSAKKGGDRVSVLFTILGIIGFLIIAAAVAVVILIVQEKKDKSRTRYKSRTDRP